jgi:hypothetical protein
MEMLRRFKAKYPKSARLVMVTKRWEHFGQQSDVFLWPLPLFLIMFG